MMIKTTYEPKSSASGRTKNRFREHTLITSGSEVDGRKSNRVYGIDGWCVLFESVERDKTHTNLPRWRGWLPLDELRVKEQA